MTTSPDLKTSELQKSFSGVGETLEILRKIDLELARGDALVVTGPSGSGKSTLLYILGLLDKPTSGSYTLLDKNVEKMSASDQAEFRNKNIGMVFQDHHLFPQLSVVENVLIPTLAGGNSSDNHQQRAEQLLKRVGLSERLAHRPAELSGGERQRVAVCRALINRPVLLLADEPTGNLDQKTAEAVGSLLLEINQEEQTILVCVTHSSELADRFPQHRALEAGRLVPVEVTADPGA